MSAFQPLPMPNQALQKCFASFSPSQACVQDAAFLRSRLRREPCVEETGANCTMARYRSLKLNSRLSRSLHAHSLMLQKPPALYGGGLRRLRFRRPGVVFLCGFIPTPPKKPSVHRDSPRGQPRPIPGSHSSPGRRRRKQDPGIAF